MSPKNLFFLLVVGLCATQMVSGHRQARALGSMIDLATSKLAGIRSQVEDAARTSVETVWGYIEELERSALKAGTDLLKANGVDVNLEDVAGLFKDNIKICTKDENLKKDAKAVFDNVATCVTKDIDSMKGMITSMQSLWGTAQNLPEVMKDVVKTCSAHSETDVEIDVLVSIDNDDFSAEAEEVFEDAQHHLSKRDLWGLSRIMNCAKAAYGATRGDMVSLPGEMLSIATKAFRIVRSAQGGIKACVAKKVAENMPAIGKLGMSVSSCVAAGVSEGDDLEAVLAANPSLGALRNLAGVAKQLQGVQKSGAFNAMQTVARIAG